MAKKKAAPKKSAAPKPAKPKRTDKKSTPRAAKKKAPVRKKAAAAKTTSVDSILKHYESERKSKNTFVETSQKKIVDMESKVSKMQDDIVKLKDQVTAAEIEVAQIDAKRDAEISQLLTKMGVQFTNTPPESTKPDPQQELPLSGLNDDASSESDTTPF